jgi:hypothetical protein
LPSPPDYACSCAEMLATSLLNSCKLGNAQIQSSGGGGLHGNYISVNNQSIYW